MSSASVRFEPSPRPFVGRHAETERLLAALGATLDGSGRIVMLVGEPGIGKTRTADYLADAAGERGVNVLAGRSEERPGAPAYWPWRQVVRAYLQSVDRPALVEDLGSGANDIARIVDDVRQALPDLPPPPSFEPDEARFRFYDAFVRFLRSAAQRRPLALILDDLHWSDLASLHLLQSVAREIADVPLLIVGTYRETEAKGDEAKAEALGALARERVYERIALTGLSESESADLVTTVVGHPAESRLLRSLYTRTEGNPFFLVEIARHFEEIGGWTDAGNADATPLASVVPESVRAVVRQRLRRLSRESLHVLDMAAILGRDAPLPVLAAMLDCDERAILPLVSEAAAAGIVQAPQPGARVMRFAHALVRDALYDSLTAEVRATIHSRAAEALEEHWRLRRDEHAGELAAHYLASATPEGTRRSADLAILAAERATADVAYEESIQWYRAALDALERESSPDAARVCGVLLALGEAQAAVSETKEMQATFRRAAELARRAGDAAALARAAIGYSRVPVFEGTVDADTVSLLEEALAGLPPGDDSLRANALSMLAYALQHAPGQQERRATLCRDAGDMARRLGDLRTLARTFYDQHSALFTPETVEARLKAADELLDLALRTDDRPMLLRARYCRIIDLVELGRLPEADTEIDFLASLARELREPWHHWYAAWFRACRALMEGRFDAGEELAQQAFAYGERVAPELALQVLGVQISMLRALQGRWGEMIPAIRSLVEEFPAITAWRCALAQHAVELGLEDEARRHFDVLASDGFAAIPHDSSWFISISQMAHVCARLRDDTRAAQLYPLLEPYAERLMIVNSALACSGSGSHFLGMLAAAMGRWSDAESHFARALDRHRRLGMRPWVAMTQLEIGRLGMQRDSSGGRAAARAALAEAGELADALGMASVAAEVPQLLAEVPAPAAPVDVAVRQADCLFRKEGEFWTVAYDGSVCRLKDSLGMRYLVQLLRQPGSDLHVTELLALVSEATPVANVPAELKTRARSHALPGLDRQAQRSYRERYVELREDLERAEADNDIGSAQRARREMEALARELAGGTRGSDAGERARTSVAKRIKAALDKIRAAHPALGRHFDVTIKTGYFCRYAPDPHRPIDWHT